MITTIKSWFWDENGSISIEATFFGFFFAAILLYVMQRTIFLTVQLADNKVANQLVSVIALRDIFFDNHDLSQSDLTALQPMIKSYYPKGIPDNSEIIVEELSYNYGRYHVARITGKKGGCQLRHPLSDFPFSIRTAFGKKNAVYRVTVCTRMPVNFFTAREYAIAESAIQPGHHH